jgi:transcriptional regulator with XRE-family HTH domain
MVEKDLDPAEYRRRALGQAIRTVREERGLTQPELAQKIGRGPQQIHRYEAGKSEIPMYVLEAIAGVLQYSVANFVRDVDYDMVAHFGGGKTDTVELKSGTSSRSALRDMAVRERLKVYPQPPTKRLPPRAYELVYDYTRKLEGIGLAPEEVEEAERFLVDAAYNKINAREPGEKSEDDLILDINAAWKFVREVVNRNGKKV